MLSEFKSPPESSRDSRFIDEDAQNALSSLQNSMWQDMMLEAEAEED